MFSKINCTVDNNYWLRRAIKLYYIVLFLNSVWQYYKYSCEVIFSLNHFDLVSFVMNFSLYKLWARNNFDEFEIFPKKVFYTSWMLKLSKNIFKLVRNASRDLQPPETFPLFPNAAWAPTFGPRFSENSSSSFTR